MNDLVARDAHGAQIPQRLQAKRLWIPEMMNLLGLSLPTCLTNTAGTIEDKLPLRLPNGSAEIRTVLTPPCGTTLTKLFRHSIRLLLTIRGIGRFVFRFTSGLQHVVPRFGNSSHRNVLPDTNATDSALHLCPSEGVVLLQSRHKFMFARLRPMGNPRSLTVVWSLYSLRRRNGHHR
jgi:hypothetical protein